MSVPEFPESPWNDDGGWARGMSAPTRTPSALEMVSGKIVTIIAIGLLARGAQELGEPLLTSR